MVAIAITVVSGEERRISVLVGPHPVIGSRLPVAVVAEVRVGALVRAPVALIVPFREATEAQAAVEPEAMEPIPPLVVEDRAVLLEQEVPLESVVVLLWEPLATPMERGAMLQASSQCTRQAAVAVAALSKAAAAALGLRARQCARSTNKVEAVVERGAQTTRLA
jgi:hypothetical protein